MTILRRSSLHAKIGETPISALQNVQAFLPLAVVEKEGYQTVKPEFLENHHRCGLLIKREKHMKRIDRFQIGGERGHDRFEAGATRREVLGLAGSADRRLVR